MSKRLIVMLITMVMVLAGCGLTNPMSNVTQTVYPDGTVETVTDNVNNSDYATHASARVAHQEAESKRIASMVEDVMENTCTDCSKVEKAWEMAFKTMAVAYGVNFKPADYNEEAPMTMVEGVTKSLGVAGDVFKVGAGIYGAVELGKAIVGGGGPTTVTMGDGNRIEGSFTEVNTEVHATTGSGDPVTNFFPDQDNTTSTY